MVFDIKQLRQKKHDAVARARAILDASGENGLTDAEAAEHKTVMASIKTLNESIAATETLMDEERNMPATAVASVSLPEGAKKPWASKGEFLCSVAKGQQYLQAGRPSMADPRLLAALGSNETVPAEGGFTVPPEYSSDLWQRIYDTGEVAKRCSLIRMTSSKLTLPAIDEDSRQDGSRWGGIQAYWTYEAQQYTGTKPKFREIQFTANKLTGLTYATEELLEDSTAFESYIDQVMPQEFAFKIDDALVNGPGSGAPLGIMNSPALITEAYTTGDNGTPLTVVAQDFTNMYSRLWAPSRKNAVWLINQSIEPSLYPLLLAGTAATSLALLYTPPGMYGNNSPYGMILGKPVIPIEQTAAFGTAGDIILASLDDYLLAKRNEITQDSSMHVAFLTGEMAFRWQVRLDGQSPWKKPLMPKASGAPTLSPFIVLQTR